MAKLTNEMGILKEKVKKNPHELRKFFIDKISPVDDTLVFAEENQKQENRSIQELMTEIKR